VGVGSSGKSSRCGARGLTLCLYLRRSHTEQRQAGRRDRIVTIHTMDSDKPACNNGQGELERSRHRRHTPNTPNHPPPPPPPPHIPPPPPRQPGAGAWPNRPHVLVAFRRLSVSLRQNLGDAFAGPRRRRPLFSPMTGPRCSGAPPHGPILSLIKLARESDSVRYPAKLVAWACRGLLSTKYGFGLGQRSAVRIGSCPLAPD